MSRKGLHHHLLEIHGIPMAEQEGDLLSFNELHEHDHKESGDLSSLMITHNQWKEGYTDPISHIHEELNR